MTEQKPLWMNEGFVQYIVDNGFRYYKKTVKTKKKAKRRAKDEVKVPRYPIIVPL